MNFITTNYQIFSAVAPTLIREGTVGTAHNSSQTDMGCQLLKTWDYFARSARNAQDDWCPIIICKCNQVVRYDFITYIQEDCLLVIKYSVYPNNNITSAASALTTAYILPAPCWIFNLCVIMGPSATYAVSCNALVTTIIIIIYLFPFNLSWWRWEKHSAYIKVDSTRVPRVGDVIIMCMATAEILVGFFKYRNF